jgi:hypothetical protein
VTKAPVAVKKMLDCCTCFTASVTQEFTEVNFATIAAKGLLALETIIKMGTIINLGTIITKGLVAVKTIKGKWATIITITEALVAVNTILNG